MIILLKRERQLLSKPGAVALPKAGLVPDTGGNTPKATAIEKVPAKLSVGKQ